MRNRIKCTYLREEQYLIVGNAVQHAYLRTTLQKEVFARTTGISWLRSAEQQ